ncbi:hypothetical protein ABZ864_40365 [Streptomyces sp. NPDC047082]|uniref:hypothetical protein n=1 Tax=Streptomyces sp. NPDC047082 TaxID=3155259 RepID=UPI003406DB97
MTTTQFQVHISPDGQLHIDRERHVVPTGVDPSQVVLHVLRLEAAGCGAPVVVHVQDDRSSTHFDMQVMPDGTTQAPPALPTAPPTAPPMANLRDRLEAAQEAGRAHDFATAVPAADDILQTLTAELGENARETLEAAQFRADLAVLSGDYPFAAASWTWLALAWLDQLGPGKLRTQQAACNAAWVWMQLPPHDAVASAPDVLAMLLEVAPPDRTHGMRTQMEARLRQITT